MCCDFNLNNDKLFSMDDFLLIMEKLRSPTGCAWDREQTHESIKRELLEETYEVVEAIDNSDPKLLQEELGDLLLQIVFHSQIEKEQGSFTFANVVNDICRKLIVRHPHVFSGLEVSNTDEILTNWDKIKIQTKGQQDIKESINSISQAMPALMRYQKFVKKANKYNLKKPITSCNISLDKENACKEDIAIALAKVVEVAHLCNIDAEQALADLTKQEMKNI